MVGSYLGPSYAQPEIERRLTAAGAVFDIADDDGGFVAAGNSGGAATDGDDAGVDSARQPAVADALRLVDDYA